MKIIGLTGTTGAGKGTFSAELKKRGVPCLDTDLTARVVVEKGKPCLNELVDHFGIRILHEDGTLDRKVLGGIVFTDKEELAFLNKVTHAYITEEVKLWLNVQAAEGHPCAVIDAPLLFESGEDAICDITVAVVASPISRLRRIVRRDGISKEDAEKRMKAQKDERFFEEHCDVVINNDGPTELLSEEADRLLARLGVSPLPTEERTTE